MPRAETDLPPIKRSKSTNAPQLVLDRMPRHMDMKSGDEYFVPLSISSARIDVEWMRTGRVPLDAECVVMLFDRDLKRSDYLTSQRKLSRCKSISFLEEAQTHSQVRKESIGIKFKSIGNDVSHIVMLFIVKSNSKTLADVTGPTMAMCDTGYFPGSPEVLRFSFDAEERFYPGAVIAIISDNHQSGELQRMWSLRALETPLVGRSFRQITDDVEELMASELLRTCDAADFGGDRQRVLSEELIKRALRHSGCHNMLTSANNAGSEAVETDSTSSECSDSDSVRMFYIQNGVSSFRPGDNVDSNLRPTVVRKSDRQYTTGKGAPSRNHDCGSQSDEEDPSIFHATFPKYGNKEVTRYGEQAYNIGSDRTNLYSHYLENKESLCVGARESNPTNARPLEVGMVHNGIELISPERTSALKPDIPGVMRQMILSRKEKAPPSVQGLSPKPPAHQNTMYRKRNHTM